MSSQKQLRKHAKAEAQANSTPRDKFNEKADHGLTDELMDEIDSVLEENADTFVREYVQAGGQ